MPSIESISSEGLITVNFHKPIVYKKNEWPLQVTQPDNQTLDITIDQYYLRYLKDTNSLQLNLVPSTEWYDDNLEFDWEIVSLSRTQMQIQLNFRDPIYISSSWEPDKIQISFHNTEFWLRTDDRYQFALPEGYFL